MEEKVLIKSTRNTKKYLTICIIAVCAIAFAFILQLGNMRKERSYYSGRLITYNSIGDMFAFWDSEGISIFDGIILYLGFITTCIFTPFLLAYRKVKITVTDKRVYGTASWRRRIDLPFDMISAVGTQWLDGLSVSTSSGSIKVRLIKNNKDIHQIISEQLLERQRIRSTVTAAGSENVHSNIDDLKKLKDLLDSGIITQEEFDTKKKQLLGL